MDGGVPHSEKTLRAKIIRDLSITNKRVYRESFVGKHQLLLIEKIENGVARGYGEHYLPVEVGMLDSGVKKPILFKTGRTKNTVFAINFSGSSRGILIERGDLSLLIISFLL